MKTKASIKSKRLTLLLLTIVIAVSTLLSCTNEPRKPSDIQWDGYAYTKEWATWYINHELIQNGKVPSVAIALVDDQKVVWQKAFGYADLEEKKLASPDTVYRMGSLSKQITALAIMKLYEDGIIDLDAPITDYLPDFLIQSRFPDSAPITIRSILSHHSGLPDFSNRFLGELAGLEYYERISLKDIVNSLKGEYVAHPVGYRLQYSNVGITLLGRIIEVMTGREFSEYMQENILTPLGMMDSAFLSSPEIQGKIAMGYDLNKGRIYPQLQSDYSDLPSANLYTNLNDMTGYLKFMLNNGQVNSNQFIKKEMFELMFVDSYSTPRDPNTFGLSWHLATLSTGHIWVGNGGGVNGFKTFMGFLRDEKLGFIILSNAQDAKLIPLGKQLIELMLETKLGIKQVEGNIPAPVHVDSAILVKYTGKYSAGFCLEVILKNNVLQLHVADLSGVNIKVNLIPISKTKFRFSTPIQILADKFASIDLTIVFLPGDEAKDNIMLLGEGYRWMVCPKISDVEEMPPLWNELKGVYTLETYFSEGTTIGELQVKIVDNVLAASFELDRTHIEGTHIGGSFVLNPISDEEVLMIGGFYDGETIFYDRDTGYLRWAGLIAKPKRSAGLR